MSACLRINACILSYFIRGHRILTDFCNIPSRPASLDVIRLIIFPGSSKCQVGKNSCLRFQFAFFERGLNTFSVCRLLVLPVHPLHVFPLESQILMNLCRPSTQVHVFRLVKLLCHNIFQISWATREALKIPCSQTGLL